MRTLPAFPVLLLSLVVAAAADAQVNTPPPEPPQDIGTAAAPGTGWVDFGFRGTAYGDNSDEARYQRYRDLRNGPFVEGFHWGKNDDRALWAVRATNVGYRDQQYSAEYNRFGKVRASFDFNQIPLYFSEVTRTAYTTTSEGVLGLGNLPAQVESGAATSAIYEANATPFDLRLKRTIADFRVIYSASDHLDLSAAFKNTNKSGEQPWAGTFGFSDAVELPVPVDTRPPRSVWPPSGSGHAARRASAMTDRSSATTPPPWSGRTRCARPIPRRRGRRRGGWRSGRTAT